MTVKEIANQYHANLLKAASITGLGQQIIDISVVAIDSVLKETKEHTTKSKLENHSKVLKNLYESPILGELIPTISGQQIVLTVSAFEVFMSDMVRCVGNDFRTAINWPTGSSGKIDLSILNSGVATIGDLVLGVVEQQNISFQDLQSTKRFLKEYLAIDFDLTKDEEERIILASAIRHALVHTGGVVDGKFIKQIRNTSFANSYIHGDIIQVSPEDTKRVMAVYEKAGRKIYRQISTKVGLTEGQV